MQRLGGLAGAVVMLLALASVGMAAAQSPQPDPPAAGQEELPAQVPAVDGPAAVPSTHELAVERGRVSWYGSRFLGHKTACGDRFDPKALTMAHPTLPCGTRVRVTNPANHRSVIVVVTDRGPFVGSRIGDLSRAAAHKLGIRWLGSAEVEISRVDATD